MIGTIHEEGNGCFHPMDKFFFFEETKDGNGFLAAVCVQGVAKVSVRPVLIFPYVFDFRQQLSTFLTLDKNFTFQLPSRESERIFALSTLNRRNVIDFIVPSIDVAGNNVAVAGSASPCGQPAGDIDLSYSEFPSPNLASSTKYIQGNGGCGLFQWTIFAVTRNCLWVCEIF